MAKLTAPLLSMGARGQIGKSMVIGNWRGIDYARQYVTPANPRTTAQQANRTRFALLREMYKLAPSVVRAPWDAFASGRPFTGVNKYVGENNRLLNGQTDFAAMIMSPGANGGLPPVDVQAVDGGDNTSITVTVTVTDQLPDGWTVDGVAAAAVIDQDPTGLFTGPYKAGFTADPGRDVDLGGFAPGDEVRAFGWVVYTKPNGAKAYSVSVSDLVTIL